MALFEFPATRAIRIFGDTTTAQDTHEVGSFFFFGGGVFYNILLYHFTYCFVNSILDYMVRNRSRWYSDRFNQRIDVPFDLMILPSFTFKFVLSYRLTFA